LLIACSDDDPQQEKMVIERLLDRQVDLIVTAPTHQDASYYKKVIIYLMYFFGGVAPRVPSEEGSVVAELQTQPRVANR